MSMCVVRKVERQRLTFYLFPPFVGPDVVCNCERQRSTPHVFTPFSDPPAICTFALRIRIRVRPHRS